jgi:hypothetical protein
MANIVIREILASDTVSDLVDKVNFNFDQLLLNGGGPAGPLGGSGPAGPLGPRGSIWFTANDIYNTSTTTTPDPPLVFPLWTGTPLKVNNISLPGYPQFSGDPNRYLPAAVTVTGTYPENSFIIGTTGKSPRSGDLYLQETDDTFDSFSSLDGDVWEFNGVNETWTYTGVNIKGDTGGTGATGFTEWVRTNDASPALNDFLRPEIITANDPVVRIVLGAGDAIQAEDIITEGGSYTDNVLTLFSEAPAPGNPESYRSQIALTDEFSIQAPVNSTYDYANIYTVNNTFNLFGFNDAGATNDNWNVNVTARSGNVQLQAINPILPITQTALLNTNSRRFEITNGALYISVPPVTPSSAASSGSIVTHSLTDTSVQLNITHNSNLSSSFAGYWLVGSQGKSIRLLTTDQITGANQTYLNLQTFTNGRVGIGYFGAAGINNVNGKLAINGGSSYPSGNSVSNVTFPGIIVGNTWSNSTSITFNNPGGSLEPGIIGNSIFFEGQLSSARNIGTPTSLLTLGTSAFNSINVYSSINIQQGMIGFNSYKPGGTSKLASMGSTDAGGNWYIGPGSWLHQYIPAPGTTDNLINSLVIGGNTANSTTQATTYTDLRTSIMIDTIEQQVLLNAQARFTPAGTIRMPNFISHGGAIIGRVRPNNIPTLIFGHEDAITNKNIIIGYPLGSTSTSPRIITSLPGNTLTDSRTNHTYIGTPIFIGSMNFVQGSEIATATNTSRTSYSGSIYALYYPSAYAQTKIVHGKIDGGSILGSIQNPYNTGIGLEIESRYWAVTPSSNISTTRTPVVRDNTGAAITGNRPLLITKRSASNTVADSVILFEITPQGNTSIGQPVRFPDLAVATGITTSKTTTLTTNWASNIGTTNALSAQNAGRWFNISNASAVATTFTNRSLVIGQITGNEALAQYNYDQNTGFIRAGISIDTAGYALPGNNNSSVSDIYDSYTANNSPENLTITTPVYLFKKNSSAYAAGVANPLGIKPGQTIYDSNGPGTFEPAMVKGTDVIIEGGDMIYVTDRPQKAWYAGDVYISGGQIYENTLGSGGYGNAASELQDYDWGLFGNVFLGSRITNPSSSTYVDNSVMRAGLVYVGYDFNDSTNVYDTSSNFHPKGRASLNVSAAPESIQSSRDSTGQNSNSRALNIQHGDIVTNDADAGWIEFDLGQTALRSAGTGGASVGGVFSNAINYYSGASGVGTVAASYMNTGLPDLLSNWKFYYKVIGYTVHFRLFMANLNFRTARQITGSYNAANWSDFFEIANPAIFTGGGSMTGRIPKPKMKDAYQWYNNSDFDHTSSASFYGTGTLYLRNRNISGSRISDYIMGSNNPGDNAILLKKPVAMFYDPEFERFYFKRTGVATLGDYVTINANIGGAPFLGISVGNPVTNVYASFAYQQHLTRFLIDSTGQPFMPISNASSYNWNSYMTYDLIVSGTYELDPASWFV